MKETTNAGKGSEINYIDIREKFLSLRIKDESIWVTKLRGILNSDIHKKPLGCKISNTHIRIGKVHLDTFYEAQILFSHAHWVQRFANELSFKIKNKLKSSDKNAGAKRVVFVGYETYIEPVMYLLRKNIKNWIGDVPVEYCIFEEKKFTYQQQVKDPEIRYIESAFQATDSKNLIMGTHVFFICGISTTLSACERMRERLHNALKEKTANALKALQSEQEEELDLDPEKWDLLFGKPEEIRQSGEMRKSIEYFSIIQVLPNRMEKDCCEFVVQDKTDYREILRWNEETKQVERYTYSCDDGKIKENTIVVPYIVDVRCGWYRATDCEMCYPAEVLDEKPIIETSETSVVPIQRITLDGDEEEDTRRGGKKKESERCALNERDCMAVKPIDFFKKDKNGQFVFRDYLYYGHIVRGDHHFLYYIRTNHLFADIIAGKIETPDTKTEKGFSAYKQFKTYCQDARKDIEKRSGRIDDGIHVIVSPSHFSSKMFCNAINEEVFKSKAHVISMDPRKEFRSSFKAKYSNYAYFWEQSKAVVKGVDNFPNKKLNFYFVDDQIITGSNFYRMTSLIKDLVVQSRIGRQTPEEDVQLWNGVFVLVDRNSCSTRRDYVDELSAYYPLFDIAVSSVRNYADSCPMCKMREDARINVKKSILDCNAYHWREKWIGRMTHTLDEAKKNDIELDLSVKDDLKDRRFRRLYCANELQKALNGQRNREKISDDLLTGIKKILEKNPGQHCEYIISCVKVLSKPFIYYHENTKPVAMKVLIGLMEGMLKDQALNDGSYCWGEDPVSAIEGKIQVVFNNPLEVYTLLKILINCLVEIDSTYLLHYDGNLLRDNNSLYATSILNDETILQFLSKTFKIAELYQFVKMLAKYDLANKVLQNALSFGNDDDSFYKVLLNAIKRIILGVSGDFKSERLEKILTSAECNPAAQEYVRRQHYQSIFDLSLIRAIFLENSVAEKEIPKEEKDKSDITAKYNGIIDELKKEAGRASLQFLYYDRDLCVEELFEVFQMDNDARRKPVTELLELPKNDPKVESEVIRAVNTVGFYDHKNKFLIKLHGYREMTNNEHENYNEQKKYKKKGVGDELGIEKLENEVYLLVDFGEEKQGIQTQMTCIRNIMRYRDSLTGIIQGDIDSGAIRSAVQAAGSSSFLDARKVSSHGGVRDWATLLRISYNDVKSDNEETRKRGYGLLRVLMNEIIALGAASEMLKEYFKKDNLIDSELFVVQAQEDEEPCPKNLLDQYFEDRRNKAYLFVDKPIGMVSADGAGYEINQIKCDKYHGGQFKLYPKLFYFDDVFDETDGVYQVCLIGLIDVFVRNAIEHGKRESKKVRIDIEIEGSPKSYSIAVINDIKIDDPLGRFPIAPKVVRRTSKFTEQYLKLMQNRYNGLFDSNPNGKHFVVKMDRSEITKHKAIIYVNKNPNGGGDKNEKSDYVDR